MYTDTTRVQVARAVGVWVLGLALASLPFLGGQLFVWDDPAFLIVDLVAVALGAALILGARAVHRRLDSANRSCLLGPEGATIMRGRQEFEHRVSVAARWLLGSFLLLAIGFFFLMSAASCGQRTDGYCGDVGRPSDSVMVMSQTLTLAIGAMWIGAVSLRKTHETESERIDRLVAEGQRRRRNDHPLAGSSRTGWE
jgi:hypothetical protein